MDKPSSAENPYSSPNSATALLQTGHVVGAVWEDDRVTIEFERTVEDYAIVEWFRMQHRRTGLAGWFRVILVAVALAFMLLMALSLSKGSLDIGMLGVAVVYFALVGFILSKRGRIRIVRRALKRIVTSDAHEYLIPLRVTFNQEGFDCACQWERRLRRWSAVERLIAIGDYFLLVHGGVVTLVIPKRVFANSDEAERFLEWIRAHVPVNVE